MKLTQLLRSINLKSVLSTMSLNDCVLTGVTNNSQQVRPGYIFVAIRGLTRDAHDFVPQAIGLGAVAIVGEGFTTSENLPVPYITVQNARAALAEIASLLNGNPSEHLKIIGVTGTKGKTTVTWLTHHLLRHSGYKVGLLSTVGYKLADDELHNFAEHFTTPEAPEIQSTLAQMLQEGCTHAVVEASSHALELMRLHKTKFDAAIWTNLAPEHLDFHGDMEGYFSAKRKLIDSAAFAVLNAEDIFAMRLKDHPHTTYGIQVPADWRASHIDEEKSQIVFQVTHPEGEFKATLPMIGIYNVYNALAAIAAAYHLDVSIHKLEEGLGTFAGVPGRMQVIQELPQRVIVDFAHTPESLENALKALRRSTAGRLIVVIGSAGGKRYPGKRAPLGSVATQYADEAIFTEEDSRDTPLGQILSDMMRGADEAGRSNFILIPDRYEAIRHAITAAKDGDTVLLAGKGPEQTLERANETIPWDEASIAQKILAEKNE